MSVKITEEKYDELHERLRYLKNERKDELNEAWRRAVEEGDAPETDALSLTQKLLREHEQEIIELENLLFDAEVIDSKTNEKDINKLGRSLEVVIDGKEQTVILVDPIEADPVKSKISVESPIGKALLEMEVGEKRKVRPPKGENVTVELIR
jgi:transcription elongation factor GreA